MYIVHMYNVYRKCFLLQEEFVFLVQIDLVLNVFKFLAHFCRDNLITTLIFLWSAYF